MVSLRFPWISLVKKLHVFPFRLHRSVILHNVPLVTPGSLKKLANSDRSRDKSHSRATTSRIRSQLNSESSDFKAIAASGSQNKDSGKSRSTVTSRSQTSAKRVKNGGSGDRSSFGISDQFGGHPIEEARTSCNVHTLDTNRNNWLAIQQRQFSSIAASLSPIHCLTFHGKNYSRILSVTSSSMACAKWYLPQRTATTPDVADDDLLKGRGIDPVEFMKHLAQLQGRVQVKEQAKDIQRRIQELEMKNEVCDAVKEVSDLLKIATLMMVASVSLLLM